MAGRTRKGSLWRRAVQSAATEFVSQFCSPHLAAQRTLVVKISDTSHHGKAGSNPAFDTTYRGSGLARAVASRVRFFCQEAPALMSLTTDIACSPACLCNCRCAAMFIGKAVVKMSVTSGKSAARFCGSEVAWFKSRRQKCRSSVIALRSGNSFARSPPTSSRSVVKIAVTSSAKREVAGSNPVRRSMRR
jgi:hypothetical protein